MSIHATRATLIRKYLRARGEGQVSRLLERLPVASLANLFNQLNDRDLRRIAAALFAEQTLETTISTYSDDALSLLVEAAESQDAIRLLGAMPNKRADAILQHVSEAPGHALQQALREHRNGGVTPQKKADGEKEVSSILRMPRLFA